MHDNDGSQRSLIELWSEHFTQDRVTPSRARRNQTHSTRLISSQIPRRVGSFESPYKSDFSIYNDNDSAEGNIINLLNQYALDKTSSSLHSADGTKRGFIGYTAIDSTYIDAFETYTTGLINSVANNAGRTFE
jgi:hypothetical protein